MCADPTAALEQRDTMRRRECSLQDLLLQLARENLELRYENGAEVSVTLADTDDGSVELHAGGQSWQPWTNGSSESAAEVCTRDPDDTHDMQATDEALQEDESELGGGKLQYDGKYGPKLASAWERMQSTSGRGRRGEEARQEARRLKEVARQAMLANRTRCVLCGQPPPTPNGVVPASSVRSGKSGLPRFG